VEQPEKREAAAAQITRVSRVFDFIGEGSNV